MSSSTIHGRSRLLALLFVAAALLAAIDATACAETPGVYLSPSGSDSAACTQAEPCKSFDRGYRVAAPGAEVMLAGGVYPSQTLSNLPQKSSADRVVFAPLPGATVRLGDLNITNSANVEVRDVRVDGWNLVKGARHIVLRNVQALDGTGGYFSGTDDIQVLGGEIGRIDPDDGIHMNNGGGTNSNIVIDGLFMHDLTRNNDSSAHDDCLQAGDARNLTIRNSRFVNCGTQGVFLNPYNGGQTTNVVVENNWFGPAQLGYYVLYVGDAVGVTVRNNSFTGGAYIYSSASETRMVGNILAGTDTYACSVMADNAVKFAYNVTSSSCPGATHNFVDPKVSSWYVNPSASDSAAYDLHLKPGASAINRGDPADFPPTDFDGLGRPSGGAPDAGAIEFGSTPATIPTGAEPAAADGGAGKAGPSAGSAPQPAATGIGAKAIGSPGGAIASARFLRRHVCRTPTTTCRGTRVGLRLVLRRPALVSLLFHKVGRRGVQRRYAVHAHRGINVLQVRAGSLRRGRYTVTVTSTGSSRLKLSLRVL